MSGQDSGDGAWNISKGDIYAKGVSGALQHALDQFEEQRREWHRQVLRQAGEETDLKLNTLDSIAADLRSGAGDVASSHSVSRLHEQLAELVQSFSPADGEPPIPDEILWVIQEKAQLLLAREALEAARESVVRLFGLGMIARRLQPSGRGAAFLRRVSRCYTFGFYEECFIYCRSILESEIRAEISSDECGEQLGAAGSTRFTLEERIRAARQSGRLSTASVEAANYIRNIGNRVIHEAARPGDNPLFIIEQTLRVISELHGRRP